MPDPSAKPWFDDDRRAFAAVLALAVVLTIARLIAIFATSLELYPDEAQYWLWSKDLHWGYVSKPPMIAALIRLTTGIGGDGEAWTRASAPLLHAVAMLALYPVGRRVYSPAVGLMSALLYGLMPAVQISSLFIATDAPLMTFLALALWTYVAMVQAHDARRRGLAAAGFGLAMGLAFLSKFAAVFVLIGAALHALIDREARRTWGGWAWAAALAPFALVFGPNLVWQGTHGFATVSHTAEVNAHWSLGKLFNFGSGGVVEFVLGQFGVMGPIPFGALIGGAVLLWRRRRLEPQDRMLLCFTLPPVILVTIQSLISRAHAHWAAAGYLAGVVLVSAWLIRWRARRWRIATFALQGLAAMLILVIVAAPQIMDATGNGRRLGRVRGWAATAAIVTSAARAQPGLTAIAAEDRYMFNELAYYGRGYFASAGAPPLRMRPAIHALDEAELSAPLAIPEGGKVLIAEIAGQPDVPALPQDFAKAEPLGRYSVRLDARHVREIDLFIGSGFNGSSSGKGG
jgi:4-amino-4-deoxy-L-arabinose transferase-like glycosyltransferase